MPELVGDAQQVEAPTRRALSKTEQLVADVNAAGGVLRVPGWRAPGEPDYQQRVRSAQRFGKVPAGKRLTTAYVRGELEIRLEDAIAGTNVDAAPVPVPARISRLHAVARQFRDRTDQHEVSRAALSRCVRIIHGLTTETERRGYVVANVVKSTDGRRDERWSAGKDGHLVITIRGHSYRLRVAEEKVSARGAWEQEARWRSSVAYPQYLRQRSRSRYDADATGRLTITLNSGHGREGRPSSWGDRKSWTLEEKLPDVLRKLEIRAAEDDHRRLGAERAAAERRRRWELAMQRAKQRFVRAHRAETLRQDVTEWQEARVIREYLTALQETQSEGAEAAAWIDWIRDYVERLDPSRSRRTMPMTPEPSPEDLKPFLDGLSPYGPAGW